MAFQSPSNPPHGGTARRLHVLKTMVVPRKVLAAAIIYAARCFTQASPSGTVPSNAAGTPTAPAFVADSGGSTGSNVVSAGVPLSSPTSGQISFRTKTRNGVRGAAPAMCSGVAPASTTGVGVCGRVLRRHRHPRPWQHSTSFLTSPLVNCHTIQEPTDVCVCT